VQSRGGGRGVAGKTAGATRMTKQTNAGKIVGERAGGAKTGACRPSHATINDRNLLGMGKIES
jgi:hypothetical protein